MGPELNACTGRTSCTDGFSLIELMVVIAILATLSVGAVIAATPRSAGARSDVAQFQQAFERSRDMAVLGARKRGLFITAKGVQEAAYANASWVAKGRVTRWGRAAILTLSPGSQPRGDAPQLIFLPDGQTSAFVLVFRGGGRCESDGWTGLKCAAG